MAEWIVEIVGEPFEELLESLERGPLFEDGRVLITKHLVARELGMKIEVFSNEHPPPHFRVKVNGAMNCYRIDNCEPLYPNSLKMVYWNIKRWHEKNREKLIDAWNDTRPSDCPVGLFKA